MIVKIIHRVSCGVWPHRFRVELAESSSVCALPRSGLCFGARQPLVALAILVAFAPSLLMAQSSTCLMHFPSNPDPAVNCYNFSNTGYPSAAAGVAAAYSCIQEYQPCLLPDVTLALTFDNGVYGGGEWGYTTYSTPGQCTGGGVELDTRSILWETGSNICQQYYATATIGSLAQVNSK